MAAMFFEDKKFLLQFYAGYPKEHSNQVWFQFVVSKNFQKGQHQSTDFHQNLTTDRSHHGEYLYPMSEFG